MLFNIQSPCFSPLFYKRRETLRECAYFGALNVSVAGETCTPNTDGVIVAARSTLKPWQLATCLPSLGTRENWAIGMASSSGEPIHHEAIKALSNRFSIDPETELKCPQCYSHATKIAAQQIASNTPMARINHFCCGKHLAHYIAARQTGQKNYLSTKTAQHSSLKAILTKNSGTAGQWVTDSCGMPCWTAPMANMAKLWNSLSSTQDHDLKATMSLWANNPIVIGGSNRVDTEIITFGEARLYAKEGADGLLFVHALGTGNEPPVTILVKLAQASTDAQLCFALCTAIDAYVPRHAKRLHDLREYFSSKLHTEFIEFEATSL